MRPTATAAERSSTDGRWRIQEPCPQCGGAVSLSEGDRVLECPFCRVRQVLVSDGPLRYFLAPRRPDDGSFFYVPYWRLKGQLYSTVPHEVRHTFVDRTVRARAFPGAPATLGVRPQAMTLRLTPPAVSARCLRPEIELSRAVAECGADLAELEEAPILEHNFVGTRTTQICLPLEVRDGIYDGVLDRKIAALPRGGFDPAALGESAAGTGERSLPAGADGTTPADPYGFIPAICPGCGADLEAETDSLVLPCRRCGAAWTPGRERLDPVHCETLQVSWDPAVYLPFWRIRARVAGCSVDTRADLARFANLPKVTRPADEQAPLWFWFPAFKLNPDHWLRMSRALVVAGLETRDGAICPGLAGQREAGFHSATLALADARGVIRVLLADMVQPKPPFYEMLKSVEVRIERSVLVYLPFAETTGEWTHAGLPLTVSPRLLEFGRQL